MDGYDMDEAERRANERLQLGDGEAEHQCPDMLCLTRVQWTQICTLHVEQGCVCSASSFLRVSTTHELWFRFLVTHEPLIQQIHIPLSSSC